MVPADVAYPTDSGLLAKGVAKMAKAVERLKGAGLAPLWVPETAPCSCAATPAPSGPTCGDVPTRQKTRSWPSMPRWSASRPTPCVRPGGSPSTHSGRAPPRRDGSPQAGGRGARPRGHRRAGGSDRPSDACQRLAGVVPDGATRLVSLHDPDARPIRKGRLGKPVEFGYKAQVLDNEDGVILDYNVEIGNPPDAPMLVPAVRRATERGRRVPVAVTADRGYGEGAVEDELEAIGVRHVVLPTKGKPNAARRIVESEPTFQDLVRWRTGCEGRISCLKRDFGWGRTRMDGIEGARTWCGQGVFNHNLVKIAGLMATPP